MKLGRLAPAWCVVSQSMRRASLKPKAHAAIDSVVSRSKPAAAAPPAAKPLPFCPSLAPSQTANTPARCGPPPAQAWGTGVVRQFSGSAGRQTSGGAGSASASDGCTSLAAAAAVAAAAAAAQRVYAQELGNQMSPFRIEPLLPPLLPLHPAAAGAGAGPSRLNPEGHGATATEGCCASGDGDSHMEMAAAAAARRGAGGSVSAVNGRARGPLQLARGDAEEGHGAGGGDAAVAAAFARFREEQEEWGVASGSGSASDAGRGGGGSGIMSPGMVPCRPCGGPAPASCYDLQPAPLLSPPSAVACSHVAVTVAAAAARCCSGGPAGPSLAAELSRLFGVCGLVPHVAPGATVALHGGVEPSTSPEPGGSGGHRPQAAAAAVPQPASAPSSLQAALLGLLCAGARGAAGGQRGPAAGCSARDVWRVLRGWRRSAAGDGGRRRTPPWAVLEALGSEEEALAVRSIEALLTSAATSPAAAAEASAWAGVRVAEAGDGSVTATGAEEGRGDLRLWVLEPAGHRSVGEGKRQYVKGGAAAPQDGRKGRPGGSRSAWEAPGRGSGGGAGGGEQRQPGAQQGSGEGGGSHGQGGQQGGATGASAGGGAGGGPPLRRPGCDADQEAGGGGEQGADEEGEDGGNEGMEEGQASEGGPAWQQGGGHKVVAGGKKRRGRWDGGLPCGGRDVGSRKRLRRRALLLPRGGGPGSSSDIDEPLPSVSDEAPAAVVVGPGGTAASAAAAAGDGGSASAAGTAAVDAGGPGGDEEVEEAALAGEGATGRPAEQRQDGSAEAKGAPAPEGRGRGGVPLGLQGRCGRGSCAAARAGVEAEERPLPPEQELQQSQLRAAGRRAAALPVGHGGASESAALAPPPSGAAEGSEDNGVKGQAAAVAAVPAAAAGSSAPDPGGAGSVATEVWDLTGGRM
jgi:hypothetical protein